MSANRSNKDLADDARALGEKLGKQVDTQGLGNQQLSALVAELQAAVDSAQALDGEEDPTLGAVIAPLERLPDVPAPINGAGDDEIGGAPDDAAQPALPQRVPYAIAPGRSLVGPRGHLNAGDEFKLEDVHGDQKRLNQLIAEGFVVARRKP